MILINPKMYSAFLIMLYNKKGSYKYYSYPNITSYNTTDFQNCIYYV